MSRKTRKLIWSAPLVAVLAVVGALAMFVMLAPDNVQADGAPGPVTGLTATPDGRYQIDLNWTAPATGTVTGYRIDTSSDAFIWTLLKDDTDSTNTSYPVGELDASSTHYFRVYALNGDHTGPVSINPIYVVATTGPAIAPDAVTGLTATRDLENKITLTWSPPADNGGAAVARYCVVVRGTQAGASFAGLTDTNCAAATGATEGQGIGTIITSLNADPQTAISTAIVVEASAAEADDDTASWMLSMGNGTELADDVVAQFQVVAVNVSGRSVSSNIAEGKTAAAGADELPSPPGAPTNLKMVGENTSGTDNTVSLYWSAPAGLGAEAVAQVQRQVFTPGTGWAPENSNGGWMDPSVEANLRTGNTQLSEHAQFVDDQGTDLDDKPVNSKVRYRVRYMDENLVSGWALSRELSFPFPQDPGDPTTNTINLAVINVRDADNPNRLRVVDDYEYFTRIDLAWMREAFCTTVGDAACEDTSMTSTYAIDVSSEGTDTPEADVKVKWDRLTGTISFSSTVYRHHSSASDDATKLESDDTRHYRVFPWHSGRYGYPAVVTGHTKLASVPDRIPQGGLRVAADGETKLRLRWDAPANHGGAPVTHYLVQVNRDRDNNTDLNGNAFEMWCDVVFQEADEPRTYTYGGKITSTTKPGCADITNTPTAPLTATGEELKASYARWFRVLPLNKKSNMPPADAAGIATGWTLSETSSLDALTAGQVHADSVNSAIPARGKTAGAGLPSGDTRPGAPIGLVAETALNVHSQLSTQKGVLLTWDWPAEEGSATIMDYVIQRKIDDGAWTTLNDGHGTAATDWTDPKLPTATEQFAYQVAAVNTHGTGPWSNMAYYTTTTMTMPDHTHPPTTAALTAPTGVTATSDTDGEVTVMWMGGDNADRYFIIALERGSSPLVIGFERAESGESEATITGLNSDASHLVIVLALKGTGDDRELEYGTDTVTVQ